MALSLPLNCFLQYLCLVFLIPSCFPFTLEPATVNNYTEGFDLCLEFTELENGNVTLVSSDKGHQELHLSCLHGFFLEGKSVINCDNDLWTKPYCVHEGCEEPPMLANGEIRVEGYKDDQQYYAEGVVLEYQCMNGFHLSTLVKRRVCEKGRWTGQDPSCEPDGCSKPNLLVNGHFVPDYDISHYPVGSYVHFSCEIGFQLQGVPTVQCVGNGEWSHTLPQCLRVVQDEGLPCAPPPLGPHVVVTAVRGLQSANSAISGTTLEASCETGYRDQINPCVPSLLRCIDGNWQGHFANCVSVDSCMCPLNIPHATMLRASPRMGPGYPVGSRVAYSCHPDYQLVGNAILTCQQDGCWDPYIFPVCHPRHQATHIFDMNSGVWGDYVKLNTSLFLSMIAMASVSVIMLSVCLVILCRPNPAPTPPVNLTPPPATDPDRVALIAFADGVQNCGQSVLPSYEEAVRGSLGGVLNYRLHRPHWTTMLGGQRRGNRDNSRQTPSMRDSMGSTDTVTVSEVSTNVTVDTVSSHSGSQTASCHAICGSLASFDTSSVLNTDGVPLLEVNELEEVTSSSQGGRIVLDPDFKLQSDIASIHS
ncbi:sushi, von Willebrand factor type A, EGF and pentraxin domain-containing protein 1-like isoform X1 [Macrosteles quadrilineatus]|uniref:sushi, von Willebrand factor type A, EGF and pentraxin domain-containing protein 1-like isoform X1 n=1 Tax=Macrosteles quadrilineatus TaxID=74068 RepID=UPI0023E27E68|nr:sushi, von Willebrand factor type A, EGF and pentraxin domain-containing protein 1-like isoform X1 [Macrosteles quadrilineatus]